MKRVWKYPLGYGMNKLTVPCKWEPCYVANQDGVVTLWLLVSRIEEKLTTAFFEVAYTGQEVEYDREYVGTCEINGLIYHVFFVNPFLNPEEPKHETL